MWGVGMEDTGLGCGGQSDVCLGRPIQPGLAWNRVITLPGMSPPWPNGPSRFGDDLIEGQGDPIVAVNTVLESGPGRMKNHLVAHYPYFFVR